MDIPWIRGRVAAQAHVGLPEGTVEEEYGRGGFFGRYAHLYRRHPPVGWTRIEGPLRPRAFDLRRLESEPGGDWLTSRQALLGNDDVVVSLGTLSQPMPYLFRNADSDELLFVHAGVGRLETDFGSLAYEAGDYLVLPRGVSYRLLPSTPASSSRFLVIESKGEVTIPERGPLGQHALFDPAVLQVPTPEGSSLKASTTGEYELVILRLGEVTRVFYPFNPHDVVGWKGTVAPLKLNVRDIRPVTSERYHLPPSAHTTFLLRDAVVCSFLPRPLENGDPAALKVPFFHSNIDYDEVIFYHSGQFFSRPGLAPGMVTFHPQGIHHGPQPGAAARAREATRTDEVAVMLDTRHPLKPLAAAARAEVAEYWKSWQSP
jgi:homogentisate 1,2-dioxygenase